MGTSFEKTAQLLDHEIARLEEQVEHLKRERIALKRATRVVPGLFDQAQNTNGTADAPLTCAEAIDHVLEEAHQPIAAREIADRIELMGLQVRGQPNVNGVRSVLHRRHEAMRWKRTGAGKRVRWSRSLRRIHLDEEAPP